MSEQEAAMAKLDRPTRVYVLAIRAAETEYRNAVKEAARVRQQTIDEALEACHAALACLPVDNPGHEKGIALPVAGPEGTRTPPA